MKYRLPRVILTVTICMTLSSCGVLVTSGAKWLKGDNPDSENKPVIGKDSLTKQAAYDFGLMAWFALTSYRDDLKDSNASKDPCGLEQQKYAEDMPKYSSRDNTKQNSSAPEDKRRWKRWPVPLGSTAKQCYFGDKSGLFYETYVYENHDGNIAKAVISFRGTENTSNQFLKDWSTNVMGVLGLQPFQYSSARGKIPDLIFALRKYHPGIEIYAVGHSLGGGLAQQAGYLSRHVKEIYAFNSSPVINWSRLKWAGEVDKKYPIIFRIFHNGEILEVTRQISSAFTDSRFGRSDLGVQFKNKSFFTGHSMNILACTFAEILVKDDNKAKLAAHYYPKAYVEEVILTSDACQTYGLDKLDRKVRI